MRCIAYALIAGLASLVLGEEDLTGANGTFIEPKANPDPNLQKEVDPAIAKPFVYPIQGPMLLQWTTKLDCDQVYVRVLYGKTFEDFTDKLVETDEIGMGQKNPANNSKLSDDSDERGGSIYWTMKAIKGADVDFDPSYWWGLMLYCASEPGPGGHDFMYGPHFLLQGNRTDTAISGVPTTVDYAKTTYANPTTVMNLGPVATGDDSVTYYEASLTITNSYEAYQTKPTTVVLEQTTLEWSAADFSTEGEPVGKWVQCTAKPCVLTYASTDTALALPTYLSTSLSWSTIQKDEYEAIQSKLGGGT